MHKALHKVLSNESLSANTFKLRIEREDMEFNAGQCVNLGLPKTGINREYSSYSGEQEPELAFLIREVEDGDVSTALRHLKSGDSIEIDGAYGLFTLPDRFRKIILTFLSPPERELRRFIVLFVPIQSWTI